MSIAKIEDAKMKTELQTDVERLQYLAGLVASFSKDLHQQIRIAIKKYGVDAVVNQIGCDVSELQNIVNNAQQIVEKSTGEKLKTFAINKTMLESK